MLAAAWSRAAGGARSHSEPGRDPAAGPADFYALALLTVSQAGPVSTPEPCQGRYVPTRQMCFSGSKVQREAAGTDPELQESDVTALASPHSVLIILKAMRPSIKAGAGVTPLSTSGRVGRAGSTSSGGCTEDTVGRAAGPHAQPKARGSGGEGSSLPPGCQPALALSVRTTVLAARPLPCQGPTSRYAHSQALSLSPHAEDGWRLTGDQTLAEMMASTRTCPPS